MGAYRWVIFLNFLPFVYMVSGAYTVWHYSSKGFGIVMTLLWVYVLPPLLTRVVFLFTGFPTAKTAAFSKSFYGWWTSVQLQMIFVRFPFLEEILRMIPGMYSIWLRLWGAKIGKYVYWGPALRIMDRPALAIGDQVIVGYGVGFTAHHFQMHPDGRVEFVFGRNIVGDYAILGGESGLAPGAEVGPRETLPSTMGLAPFYQWKNGRRRPRGEEGMAP